MSALKSGELGRECEQYLSVNAPTKVGERKALYWRIGLNDTTSRITSGDELK